VRGGESLGAYPQYHRVVVQDGRYVVADRGIALRHRLQVGTIVGEASMLVKWLSAGAGGGAAIGQVEESFIARLKAGDCFVFAGRVLEYVRTQDMVAYVRKSTGKRGVVPSWAGGKMPLSSELASATLAVLVGVQRDGLPAARPDTADADTASAGVSAAAADPELLAARPMLDAQQRLSQLPGSDTLLVEQLQSREGHHLFIYPFAGRLVHLGLASLLGWRLARDAPNTFSISVNDYGFELLSADAVDVAGVLDQSLFGGPAGEPRDDECDDECDGGHSALLHDVLASLNSSELAQRRFREIARVAGLVFTGYPGAPKSTRQLQASAGLFYQVFRQYDPANRLLGQAQAEVLAQELDLQRLSATLARLRTQRVAAVTLAAPSPLALALMVERFREQLSTEKLGDRLARMVAQAEAVLQLPAAGPAPPLPPLPPLPPRSRSRRKASLPPR